MSAMCQHEPMTEHSERRDDEAHDVLAADEFAMPTSDERLADPSGIHEPHDVLAAEEFAMPGGGEPVPSKPPAGRDPRTLLPLALAALLMLLVLRRRR